MKTTTYILGIIITIIFHCNIFASAGHAIPAGLVYQLNIGPLDAPVKPEVFKSLHLKSAFENDDGIWYCSAFYSTYNEAVVSENTIRFYGIHAIRIQAYFNKRPIELEDALTLQDNQNRYDEKYILSEHIPVSDLDRMISAKLRGARLYYAVKVKVYSFQDVDHVMDILCDLHIRRSDCSDKEYDIGWFDSMQEAHQARLRFMDAGLQNVFIAAYVDNERISFFEAEQLEGFKSESFAQNAISE